VLGKVLQYFVHANHIPSIFIGVVHLVMGSEFHITVVVEFECVGDCV
jgi:hypothetical protein